MQYIALSRRKAEKNSEFGRDEVFDIKLKREKIFDVMDSISTLIRNWCEGMDLVSSDTKKQTQYYAMFILLFENSQHMTYKEISQSVGGANVEKFVAKCNMIAICKTIKSAKINPIYKQLLDKYYKWLDALM